MSKKNSHTSALFHYTRNQNILFNILKEGLKFSYCKEKFSDNLCLGLPMISFCDIPIGNSAEHSSKYGQYAIALSKKKLLLDYKGALGPVNYFTSLSSVKAAFEWTDDLFSFTINDEVIDLTDKETYFLKCRNINISNIFLHNGITFEVSYTEQIKQFNIENDASYSVLRAKKQAYNDAVKSMITDRATKHYTGLTNLHNKYQAYLLQLNQDLDKYRKENGLVE